MSKSGFEQHGVKILKESEAQTQCRCPLCRKDKFFFNPTTFLWDCKVCALGGNFAQFLTWRMDFYVKNLRGELLNRLAVDRSLRPQTFAAFGLGYCPESDTYMIPMRWGNVCTDIHRYRIGKGAMSTSGGKLNCIAPLNNPKTKRKWVCEGEWDAMALAELLTRLKLSEAIYASPGAGTFPKHAGALFDGSEACLLFDNDEPGRKGGVRTGNLLSGHAITCSHLIWPEGSPKDIRDLYVAGKDKPQEVFDFIVNNLSKAAPAVAGAVPKAVETKPQGTGVGYHHAEVLEKYRKWLCLRKSQALEVMYGTVFANRLSADPLWMFIIAPPGGSKTELLITLSDCNDVLTTTSLTPQALMSGANTATGDPSLIPMLNGKLLIIKDFTTILNLQQAIRDEIFGILRDAYDGKTEKRFGNGVHRSYVSKFGILAGVTPAIDEYSGKSTILGERFIKYRIPSTGRIQTGQDVIQRALNNLNSETTMRQELREVATEVLSRQIRPEDIPPLTEDIKNRMMYLAQWVAALRGQVSRDKYTGVINFKPISEIGTRLAKQFCCLAMGMAIYRQESYISEDVMKTIYKVCKDTAPDRVEEVVKQMYLHGFDKNHATTDIGSWTRFPANTIMPLLQDLELLHIIKRVENERGAYKLNPSMAQLMQKTGMYTVERKHAEMIDEAKTEVKNQT